MVCNNSFNEMNLIYLKHNSPFNLFDMQGRNIGHFYQKLRDESFVISEASFDYVIYRYKNCNIRKYR